MKAKMWVGGNIKMDHWRHRMGWYGLKWSGSGKGPLEGSCKCGNEPSGYPEW